MVYDLDSTAVHNLGQYLTRAFGQLLPENEVQHLQHQIQPLEISTGKSFWHSGQAAPGLYIILGGKARLLNQSGDSVTTLGTGRCFGEATLFPSDSLVEYSAKAALVRGSNKLVLGYLPESSLQSVFKHYPAVWDYLRSQAALRDIQFHPSQPLQDLKAIQLSEFSHTTQFEKHNRRQKIAKAYFPSPAIQSAHFWRQLTQRYPFFEQQSASDCGVACLKMIALYWKKHLNINRLRDLANVNRDGSSLKGLIVAAETVGFSACPVKANIDQLAKQDLPAIVHWEGQHYVVVYKMTRHQIIIVDPAIGQRTLSEQEFTAKWDGYALLLRPTPFINEVKQEVTPLMQFFAFIKPHRLILLEIFIASLLIQFLGLLTPLFAQLLLDSVVQRSGGSLFAIGFGMLIFALFRVIMTGLRQYLLDHTANKVDVALIVGFIHHTFRLPLSFFESRFVGDITSRIQENRKIQRFLTGEALSILLDLLTLFIYAGLMCWYSWKLALLVLSVVPVFALLAAIATPLLRRVSRETFNSLVKESRYLIESITGISTVKSMAIEQTVRWRWEGLLNQAVKTNFSGQRIRNVLQVASATIEAVATTALLWFGAWLVLQGQLTIGQLVAFQMLLGNIIHPFQRLTLLWSELQDVVIATERIHDVIDTKPEEDLYASSRQPISQLQGHIEFKQVTFRYHIDDDINILENLNFEIKAGQTVALVGRSGSGKTTISKLILGLYAPTNGKVLMDGQDISQVSLRSLRCQVGVVDQDTFLFGSTIRENIAIGYPAATLSEIQEAARQAGADQFIQRLPMGYETQIGEGGGLLSGGQRQRIAIARALLGNPRLLVFDEATSHLDAESERVIQTNLKAISRDRTLVIIAHRLSTVRHANLILVMDQGLLIEQGTHEELMAKRGHYFYLNQQQLDVTH